MRNRAICCMGLVLIGAPVARAGETGDGNRLAHARSRLTGAGREAVLEVDADLGHHEAFRVTVKKEKPLVEGGAAAGGRAVGSIHAAPASAAVCAPPCP